MFVFLRLFALLLCLQDLLGITILTKQISRLLRMLVIATVFVSFEESSGAGMVMLEWFLFCGRCFVAVFVFCVGRSGADRLSRSMF